MAVQMIVDMYGCPADLLNSTAVVKQAARDAVQQIGAEIVEECVHAFSPIGISYIAVITTSHFSIHTWPEYGYAAIDVFSCSDYVPETLSAALADIFRAEQKTVRTITRNVTGP